MKWPTTNLESASQSEEGVVMKLSAAMARNRQASKSSGENCKVAGLCRNHPRAIRLISNRHQQCGARLVAHICWRVPKKTNWPLPSNRALPRASLLSARRRLRDLPAGEAICLRDRQSSKHVGLTTSLVATIENLLSRSIAVTRRNDVGEYR